MVQRVKGCPNNGWLLKSAAGKGRSCFPLTMVIFPLSTRCCRVTNMNILYMSVLIKMPKITKTNRI